MHGVIVYHRQACQNVANKILIATDSSLSLFVTPVELAQECDKARIRVCLPDCLYSVERTGYVLGMRPFIFITVQFIAQLVVVNGAFRRQLPDIFGQFHITLRHLGRWEFLYMRWIPFSNEVQY